MLFGSVCIIRAEVSDRFLRSLHVFAIYLAMKKYFIGGSTVLK